MARVLCDFDGTLAHPRRWSQCLFDVLDELSPGHAVSLEDLRTQVRGGFPWHRPDEPHPHLDTPDAWWTALESHLANAFRSCGVSPSLVPRAVEGVRTSYCDAGRFELFDDTLDALDRLRAAGHEVVVLSNHVPELPVIVAALPLSGVVSDVFTSATTGFEKPHPEAFRIALDGTDPRDGWMIGDNPEADIAGAERAGMRAVLVRHDGHPDLIGAADRVIGAT